MDPNKTEGSACSPLFDAPKNPAAEPAAPAASGEKPATAAEKTPAVYGPAAPAVARWVEAPPSFMAASSRG